MLHNFKVLLIVLVVIAIGASSYAFAASNTVPDTSAGAGSGTISGYTVSDIVYNLDANPQNLASVEFTLSSAADQAKIKLVAAGSTWYDCTNTPSTFDWSCTTTGATVSSMDQLYIVATDDGV